MRFISDIFLRIIKTHKILSALSYLFTFIPWQIYCLKPFTKEIEREHLFTCIHNDVEQYDKADYSFWKRKHIRVKLLGLLLCSSSVMVSVIFGTFNWESIRKCSFIANIYITFKCFTLASRDLFGPSLATFLWCILLYFGVLWFCFMLWYLTIY